MITIDSIRRAIEATPAEGHAALPVTRHDLETLERELVAGRAAMSQLAICRGVATVIQSIQDTARA